MKTALELIQEERQRQINVEGYTSEEDDLQDGQELAIAAACYALPAEKRRTNNWFVGYPGDWPWSHEYWKPTPELRQRELIKAGALIVAEIERLQRLELQVINKNTEQ